MVMVLESADTQYDVIYSFTVITVIIGSFVLEI